MSGSSTLRGRPVRALFTAQEIIHLGDGKNHTRTRMQPGVKKSEADRHFSSFVREACPPLLLFDWVLSWDRKGSLLLAAPLPTGVSFDAGMRPGDRDVGLACRGTVLRRTNSGDQGRKHISCDRQLRFISCGHTSKSSFRDGSTRFPSLNASAYALHEATFNDGGAYDQRFAHCGEIPHITALLAPERRASTFLYSWSGPAVPAVPALPPPNGSSGHICELCWREAVDVCTFVRQFPLTPPRIGSGAQQFNTEWDGNYRRPPSGLPRRDRLHQPWYGDRAHTRRSPSSVSAAGSFSPYSLSPFSVRMAASTVGGVSDPGTNVPLHVMASVVAVPAVVSGPHTGATTDVQPGCGLSPQHAAASQTDYVWSWDHRPPPPEPVKESTLSGALPPAAAAILALTNPSAAVAGAAAATGARVPSIPVGSFAGSEEGTRLSNVRAMCQTIELARALVSVYYHPEQKPLVKTAFHRRADVVRVLEDIRQMRAILVDPVEKLQVQELEEALQVACMRSMEEEAHAGGEAEAAERALRKQLTDEEASEGSSSALAGAGAFVADAAAKLGGCIRQATSELLGADKKSKGVKRRLSGGLLKLAWKGIRRGRSGHRAPVKSNAAPPVATESSSQGSTSVARSTPPRSAGCCRSANAIAGVKENAQVLEAIDELSEDTGVGEMSCRARSDRRACRGRSLSLRTERAGRRGWGGRRSRTPAGLFERQGGSKKICKDDVVGTERTAKFRTLSSNGVADSPVFGSLQHDRPQARTGSQSVVSHRQHSASPLLPPHAEVHEAAHSLSQKPRRWRGWTRRWSHSDLQMSDLMEAADSVCDSRLLITAGRPRTELALGTAAASSTGTHTALCAECGKHGRSSSSGGRRPSPSGGVLTQKRSADDGHTMPVLGNRTGGSTAEEKGNQPPLLAVPASGASEPASIARREGADVDSHEGDETACMEAQLTPASRLESRSSSISARDCSVRKAPRRLSRFRKLRARDEPGVNKSILSQKIRNFEPSLPSNEVCTSALDTRRKSSVTSMYSRAGSADRPRRSTWNPFRVHERRSSGALGGQASSGREGTQKEQEGQDAHPTYVVSELEKRVTKGAAAVPRTSTVKGWLRRALSGSSKSKGWRPYEHEAEQGGETSAQLRRSFPTASDGGGSSVRTDSLPSQVSMTSQSMTADEAGGGLQGGAATMNKPGTIIDADVSSSGAEPAIELWLPRHVSRSSSRGLEEYHSSHKSERLSLACDTLDDVRRSAWHPGRNGGLESEALRSETRCRIRRGLPSRSPSESEEVDTSFSETIGAGSDPDGQQLPH